MYKFFINLILTLFLISAKGQNSPNVFPSKPGLTVYNRNTATASTTTKTAPTLTWSPIPLTWDAYRKINDTTLTRKVGSTIINAEAATTTKITVIPLTHNCNENIFHYMVLTLFSQDDSFVINKALKNEALLHHEQLHFDITELYARKIRQFLSEIKDPCGRLNEINQKVELLIQAEKNENNLYDIQSVHGTNKVAQKKWSDRIKKELQETIAFINPKG